MIFVVLEFNHLAVYQLHLAEISVCVCQLACLRVVDQPTNFIVRGEVLRDCCKVIKAQLFIVDSKDRLSNDGVVQSYAS